MQALICHWLVIGNSALASSMVYYYHYYYYYYYLDLLHALGAWNRWQTLGLRRVNWHKLLTLVAIILISWISFC